MTLNRTPAPSQTVTAYLVAKDAARALDFYAAAFGAVELFRLTDADGRVGHAEVAIGGTTLMLADEYPDHGALGPAARGGSPVQFHVAVEDTAAALARAVAAGAEVVRPSTDEFYGERVATVADPFGYHWVLAQKIEDVDPDEMQRRFDRMLRV